jgi:polyphosphate kinase
MPRNLDRRVEALVTVTAPALRARLAEILDVELADDVFAWELGPTDVWQRHEPADGFDAQTALMRVATDRARARA